MSGNEIKFQFKNETISFSLNDDGSVKEEGKAKKQLEKLLFDIKNSDNNPEITQKEFEMIKKLKTIFGKIGETRAEDGFDWLDKADIEFLKKWETAKKQGQKIDAFLNAELAKLEPVKINIPAPELKIDLPKPEFQGLTEQKPFVPKEPTQADKNAQFNRSMQTLKQKYNKDELDFTQEVQYVKGKYLSHIAKEALQAEGIQKPTAQKINERIAQIALVNDISDVNNVPESKFPLKVGTGRTALVQGDGNKPDQRQEGGQKIVGASSIKTGAVPVETPAGGITIKPDPDTTGWAKKDDAQLPDGITQEALNGGTLVTFTKGEGENVETKYTYEKEGIKVEAATVDELKTKIETIKTALEALEKTAPDTETEQEKATRIQGYENAIDTLLEIGTEQAVLKAQAKLAEKKAYVSAEFYEEKTIAMINSGNVALIEQMFNVPEGTEIVGILLNHVNNNPKIQDAIGAKIVELREKYNNSTITLDEQKILTTLDDYVDVPGIWILAKDPVAEVNDAEGNVTTPASAEVFEKEYKTDTNGNSAYHAKFKLGENYLTFKAKDAETLDSFLTELKVANTETDDAKKTQALQQVFSTYALNGTDSELVKSLAENASKFKATVGDLTALANKSNLDVIYAIDSSHLEDRAQGANGDNDPGCNDETTFETAKRTRIEAIMADPELAKLPENAKYLERIAGVDITEQQTAVTSITDISEWGDPTVTKYVKTADGYAQAAEGTSGTVEVKAYTKDGKTVYRVPVDAHTLGIEFTLEADSAEAVLKLKQDIESLGELSTVNDDETIAAENLAKLEVIVDLTNDKEVLKEVANILSSQQVDGSININDPAAKELVQKLLLTRDAEIVRALTHKTENGQEKTDNTLFEKDPVAIKTLAAMFKEIRDLENQGVRLTPEQIALKDVLEECYIIKASLQGDWKLSFDENGTLLTNEEYVYSETPDYSGSIHDPAYQRDKNKIDSELLNNLSSHTKDEVIMLINLETVDAESMSFIKFDKLAQNMSENDKKTVQKAYVEKAKKLFAEMGKVGDTEQLNPANARYLSSILYKISAFNEAGEDGVDPDKAVIAEILGNFFVPEGEAPNQTVKINNFRRFTYEEMGGLADAVANYGTAEQCAALANMITIDEMEDGQFVRAIEWQYGEGSHIDDAIITKYSDFVDSMTTKEEMFDFISKIKFDYHLPFAKIMEKFGDDAEVQKYLITNFKSTWSDPDLKCREKLLKACMQVDASGNYDFDKTKLPDGVSVDNVIWMLPEYCTQGEFAKMFKAVFMTLDLSDEKLLELVQCNHLRDQDMSKHLGSFVDSDAVIQGTTAGNRYINYMMSAFPYKTSDVDNSGFFENLYNNATPAKKADLINNGFARAEHVCVQSGDSIDKIVKNYLKNNLDKFPQLKASVDNDTDRSKWTDARIDEALNEYMRDFRTAILEDLGITDPTKLKVGDIIELDNIKWDEHQPCGINYNIYY